MIKLSHRTSTKTSQPHPVPKLDEGQKKEYSMPADPISVPKLEESQKNIIPN